MCKKIFYSLLWVIILWIGNYISAVEVVIPWSTLADPDMPGTSTIVNVPWSHSYLDVIALVNRYLWFAIWFVCFLFMIWNGYKLILARGDAAEMKKASNALVWCWVWIAVCFLAYVIVKFAINLF